MAFNIVAIELFSLGIGLVSIITPFWIVVSGGPIRSWPNMSPDPTYAESFIKLQLEEAEAD